MLHVDEVRVAHSRPCAHARVAAGRDRRAERRGGDPAGPARALFAAAAAPQAPLNPQLRQLSLAGGFQGLCWALFGILVIQDQNIYMPNLLGMCCNIVNIILVMVYPSKAAASAKAVRD